MLTEEYLSIKDLATRIPYSEGAIRNLMVAGVFRRGVHYFKPRGRIIFRWSKIEEWLKSTKTIDIPMARKRHGGSKSKSARFSVSRLQISRGSM